MHYNKRNIQTNIPQEYTHILEHISKSLNCLQKHSFINYTLTYGIKHNDNFLLLLEDVLRKPIISSFSFKNLCIPCVVSQILFLFSLRGTCNWETKKTELALGTSVKGLGSSHYRVIRTDEQSCREWIKKLVFNINTY